MLENEEAVESLLLNNISSATVNQSPLTTAPGINDNESVIKIYENNDLSNQIKQLDNNDLAVHINLAHKSYGRKTKVLVGLNLNVPRGAIYGLLGPSGCGKTTILRCVVGRVRLDSGLCIVLGKEPGSKGHQIPGSLVGYMPQEIALYNEFNTHETLHYFGLLHDMKSADIKARSNFLIEFLDLPDRYRLIKNLSGGQKRRVSMAIALLQEPKLLILDEPTVGVDPLLREKIWNHLIDISQMSQTTIIITTHYIEEARKADRVGLMRGGKILAENSPEWLLDHYKQDTLENVFLKLCIKDANLNKETSLVADTSKHGFKSPVYEKSYSSNYENSQALSEVTYRTEPSTASKMCSSLSRTFRMPRFKNYLGILYKDSILIRRNIGFLFFQFLIPVIQISLTCLCVGHEPFNLNFGIVNNETLFNRSDTRGSLMLIDELSNTTFKKQFVNWSYAYELTKAGKLWGYIDLSENFTDDTILKYSDPLFPDSAIKGSNVNAYLDTTSQQISYVVQAKLGEAYQAFLIKFSANFPIQPPPSFFENPVVVQQPIYGDKTPQFINFMAPGIMITIIFTITIGLTGLMFVIEKKEGLLDRSWVAGVHTIEIMAAHITAKLVIMTIQIVFLLAISIFVFDIKIAGPVLLAAVLLLLQGFCGMSYGLAISAGAHDESEVLQVAVGSVFPAMIMSGIIWPLEGMPGAVRYISYLSPLTHSAEAMRSVTSRGWDLAYGSIWIGVGTSLGWSLLFNVVAIVLFNF